MLNGCAGGLRGHNDLVVEIHCHVASEDGSGVGAEEVGVADIGAEGVFIAGTEIDVRLRGGEDARGAVGPDGPTRAGSVSRIIVETG